MKFYGILDSAVTAALLFINLYMVNYKMRIEMCSDFFGKIRHLFKTVDTFIPQPFINLGSAKGAFSYTLKKGLELFFGKGANVSLFFIHRCKIKINSWII